MPCMPAGARAPTRQAADCWRRVGDCGLAPLQGTCPGLQCSREGQKPHCRMHRRWKPYIIIETLNHSVLGFLVGCNPLWRVPRAPAGSGQA